MSDLNLNLLNQLKIFLNSFAYIVQTSSIVDRFGNEM